MRAARRSVLSAARVAGLTSAVSSSEWRRRRLLILCYHGVSLVDEHEWDPQLFMSPAAMRARFTLLRDHGFEVLPLAEAAVRLRAGTLPTKSVCLTFDDGFADFRLRALPLLEEFGYPATVYVTTHYTRYQLPIFNLVVPYLLWQARGRSAAAPALIPGVEALDASTPEARARTTAALLRAATAAGLSTPGKDALARRVADALGVDYDAVLRSRVLQLMTPAEIGALPAPLVDVQLHTHRHHSPDGHADFEREVRDNRADLAAIRPNVALEHFCYPSGRYRTAQLPWLRELGVTTATTCVPGLAGHADEPLLLPRFIDTMAVSSDEFIGWAAGVSQFLPRRRREPTA